MFDGWKRRRDERLMGEDLARLDQVVEDLIAARIGLAGTLSAIRQALDEGREENED